MTEGTDILILDENHALHQSATTGQADTVVYTENLSRAEGVLREENPAMMVADGLAQAGIGPEGNTIIDNFERGNLDPYSGSLSETSITTSRVINGDLALKYDRTGSDEWRQTAIFSRPGDGLPNYPEVGDIIEYYFYIPEITSCAVMVGLTEDDEAYRVAFTSEDDGMELAIYEAYRADDNPDAWEINNIAASGQLTTNIDRWFKVQAELHSDKIVNRAFAQTGGSGKFDDKLGEISASTNIQGNGFGWFNAQDTIAYMDYARIVGSV